MQAADILSSVPSKKPLVTLVMDEAFLKRIDRFRWQHSMKSRAAAILWLLERGLDNPGRPPSELPEDGVQ